MKNRKSDIVEFKNYFATSTGHWVHHGRERKGDLEGSWKAKLVKTRKDRELLNQFLWHAFSWERVKCRNGWKAREAYERVKDRNYYIWTASDGLGLLEFQNAPLPTWEHLENGWSSNSHLADLYVAAADASWLYALTHERGWGLGPYFVHESWLIP